MSGNPLPDIRSVDRDDLESFMAGHGEKKFRAAQAWDWLWKNAASSFEEMSNLPAHVRQLLAAHYTFHRASPYLTQDSSDGTRKTAFRLHDGLVVEGVLIPAGDRTTLCVSSQAGCALGCRFCATGKLGFLRNLEPGEIFDQVAGMPGLATPGSNPAAARISNIVFMGMGEPLLNYDRVKTAIERITSPEGLGISPQRITVSSVGIPKMIRRIADDGARWHFALSLHAATDEKRNRIIPFNLKHPLADLTEALIHYTRKTGKRFTVEYILFGGFNDSVNDARDLASFCRNFPVKINLIEYNPVKDTGFVPSAPDRTKAFAAFLESRNLVVNLRESRGKDIDAACGQLAGKPPT